MRWTVPFYGCLVLCGLVLGSKPLKRPLATSRRLDDTGTNTPKMYIFTMRHGGKKSKKSKKKQKKGRDSESDDKDEKSSSKKSREKKRRKKLFAERTCNTDEEKDCFRPCKRTHRCGKNDKECLQMCKRQCCTRDSESSSDDDEKSKRNDERLCDRKDEKECRRSCFDEEKCDEDEDCEQKCRMKCCDSTDEKRRRKPNRDRLCNTAKEKRCRRSCFDDEKCDEDDDCEQKCRMKCCDSKDDKDDKKRRKPNVDRLCDKKEEKECRKSCFEEDSCDEDDEFCQQRCRFKCCDYGSDSDSDSDDRLCDKMEEKICRGSCFEDSSCDEDDDDCQQKCRMKCCDSKDEDTKSKLKIDRLCDTEKEKKCRKSCFEDDSCDEDDEFCQQQCRFQCCSYGSDDDDRLCDKMEEKICRGSCFEKSGCDINDEDCQQKCRMNCCSDDSDGSEDSDDESSEDDRHEKGDDDGSTSDRACDEKGEKECRDSCYEDECENDDGDCRKQCRKECCSDDGDLTTNTDKATDSPTITPAPTISPKPSVGPTITPAPTISPKPTVPPTISPTDLPPPTDSPTDPPDPTRSPTKSPTGPTDVLFTGNLPVDFRFNSQTSVRITPEDIMSGSGNTIKKDLEGGLKLLVPEIVEELYGTKKRSLMLHVTLHENGLRHDRVQDRKQRHLGTQQSSEQEQSRRRWLRVEFSDNSQPEIKDVSEVDCPINEGEEIQGGCKRIEVEVVLKVTDENPESVKRGFRAAIIDAISEGRLLSKVKEFNPTFGIVPQREEPTQLSTDGGGLSPGEIAGIAIASFVFLLIMLCAFRAIVKTRQQRNESDDGSYNDDQYDNEGGNVVDGGEDPDARYDREGLPVDVVSTERDSYRPSTQITTSTRRDQVGTVDSGYGDSLHDHPDYE